MKGDFPSFLGISIADFPLLTYYFHSHFPWQTVGFTVRFLLGMSRTASGTEGMWADLRGGAGTSQGMEDFCSRSIRFLVLEIVRSWAPICSNMLQLLCVPVKLKRAFPGLDTASLGRSMKQATKHHQTLLLDSRDMLFLCQVKVRGFHTFIYSMCFYVFYFMSVSSSLSNCPFSPHVVLLWASPSARAVLDSEPDMAIYMSGHERTRTGASQLVCQQMGRYITRT
jgi:hypothetical protein